MAEIPHGSAPQPGPTTTTSSTWQTVLTLSDAGFKVNNGVYMLFAVAKIGSDNISSANAEFRIVEDPGGTPLQLDRSYQRLETASTTLASYAHPYNFFTVFTQPATAVDIEFQQESTDGTTTVRTDDLHIFWIRLNADLTEDTDWRVTVDAGPDTHTATMVSRVSETWTPATANDDWLIVGCAAVDINQTGNKYEIELWDNTGSAVLAYHHREGEDELETQEKALFRLMENLPATEQVVQLRTRDTGGTTFNVCTSSEIFVLNLAVFAEYFYQRTAARLQQTDSAYKAINQITFTPAAADFLLLSGVTSDAQSAGRRHSHQITLAGTSTPANFGDAPSSTQTFDASDDEYTMVVSFETLAASEHLVDVDAKWSSSSGTGGWLNREILALSMELVAGGTTFFETIAVASTMTPAVTPITTFLRTLAVGSTMTAALTRANTFLRTLAVSSTMTPVLARVTTFLRTLAVGSTMTPVVSKGMFVALAVASTMTPVLAQVKLFLQTLAVASTMTAAFVKDVKKFLSVTSTMTPGLARVNSFFRTLARTSVMTPAFVKDVKKFLSVTSTMTPAIAQARSYFQTLAASSTMTGVIATLKILAPVGGAATKHLVSVILRRNR